GRQPRRSPISALSSAEVRWSPARAGPCTSGTGTPLISRTSSKTWLTVTCRPVPTLKWPVRSPASRAARLARPPSATGMWVRVDVVARVLAVPVDDRLLAGKQLQAEDGHDAGLAVRVLARPVDVRVAQGDVLQAVLDAVAMQVVLEAELGHAVGGHRPGRVALG